MNPAIYYLSGVEAYPDYIPTEVFIGGQIWDQKNLNTARYRDGTPIPTSTAWVGATTGIWRYYSNLRTNGPIYGRLYNWYAAMGIWDAASLTDPLLRKNIAPTGWRVATEADWAQLASYVTSLTPTGTVGNKLREIGTSYWTFFSGASGTDLVSFKARGSGQKAANGTFSSLTLGAAWWTATTSNTIARYIDYNNTALLTSTGVSANVGWSIRLIKEDIIIPGFDTTAASNIAVTSVTSGATFSDLPSTPSLSDKGICYGTESLPNVVTNSFISAGSGTTPNPYIIDITGLTPNVTYYIRAYATLADGSGVAYSTTVVSFTTPDGFPTVTTDAISDNTTGSTATSGGNVTSDGGFTLFARGVCWSTSVNPTIANSKTVDGSTTGAFTSSITGLSPDIAYNVRAYATNFDGTTYRTAYGANVAFSTPSLTVLLYAYSIRRVVPGYTGPLIRVRNGSLAGSPQFDIPQDGSGNLDTTYLISVISLANVGYVTTFYDQTGSGKNMITGTSAGREPIIVNTGKVLVTKTGPDGITVRPATRWGLNFCNMAITGVSIQANYSSIFIVCSNNTSSLTQRGISFGSNFVTNFTIFPYVVSGVSDRLFYNNASRITMGTTSTASKIYSMLAKPTGVQAWKNNVQIGGEVLITNPSNTATSVIIGANINTGTELFNGTIQEILFYVGDLYPTGPTSRSSITADAMTYYGIT